MHADLLFLKTHLETTWTLVVAGPDTSYLYGEAGGSGIPGTWSCSSYSF